jgi:hypothetical protein
MSYPSVDALQKILCDTVFHYAIDKKKAAGRALGTLVEIITFYTLRSWEFRDSIAIERGLAEFGNPEITHNVEYSLHPIIKQKQYSLKNVTLPITAHKLRREIWGVDRESDDGDRSTRLLTKNFILRNSCTIAETATGPWVVHLDSHSEAESIVTVSQLHKHPYALFECKRVGIEAGQKKGPQTIEKAKQGAYVARTVSSLQKVRLPGGKSGGLIHKPDGTMSVGLFYPMLQELIFKGKAEELRDFILTVGVVSNHGNWFTAELHNKEMKVLAQSYDWLLFLTDAGLSDFINELLLKPTKELAPARTAFLASYTKEKTGNRFTKVQMDRDADAVLVKYFSDHKKRIESWFNVIAPRECNLDTLRKELLTLQKKDWTNIFAL